MACLFICTRQEENLKDYGIYGRDLAPVTFEETFLGLALWHDPCSDSPEFCLIQGVPSRIYLKDGSKRLKTNGLERNRRRKVDDALSSALCPYCDSKYGSLCTRCYEDVKANKREDFVLIYEPSYVRLTISRRMTITFPSDLAFYVFQELTNSRTFRKKFCKFIRRRYQFNDVRNVICKCEGVQQLCEISVTLPYVIEIVIELANSAVCLAWCYRLEALLRKRAILEETMAWLSTLGGGYSSLGDYFIAHSKMAGSISVTQLQISMEMGDPVMAAKCRLFFALSLMQRGALKQSRNMIRQEFHFAKSQIIRDQKLIDMCLGLWSKLQFYHSRRKSKLCKKGGCYGNRNKDEDVYVDHMKTR